MGWWRALVFYQISDKIGRKLTTCARTVVISSLWFSVKIGGAHRRQIWHCPDIHDEQSLKEMTSFLEKAGHQVTLGDLVTVT